MERRNKLLGILCMTVIMASIFAPMFLIQPVNATDPDSWYTNVSGVLASDYYSLYPFNAKNLKIGFSKFGEMIDSRETQNVGLEYGNRDPFAPPAGTTVPTSIPKNKWSEGWFINITYNRVGSDPPTRNVWACALHSDPTFAGFGNDWIRVSWNWMGGFSGGATSEADETPLRSGLLITDPTSSVHIGGRKTNGTVTTDDLKVLYNGPRMYIARTVNHVYDWIQTSNTTGTDEPLVDIVFTIIFNKVQKEVVILKDVKIRTEKFQYSSIAVPGMDASGTGLIVQFSNRGEWDLGPAGDFRSYAHFYTADSNASKVGEGQSTVYDEHYHLNPTLPASAYYSRWGSEPKAAGTYDVAQIISSDNTTVGWAAYWPSLSDYSIDAGVHNQYWRSLLNTDTHYIDGSPSEPWLSPYTIGEWDFFLSKDAHVLIGGRYFEMQFRGVSVYGVTDLWDGRDLQQGGLVYGATDQQQGLSYTRDAENRIDAEVRYQLNEVFNPWDLYSAVEKDTRRWVEFHNVTTAEKTVADLGTNLTFLLTHSPVKYAADWDTYCNFTERVEWGNALKHPARSKWVYPATTLSISEPYELFVNSTTGVGNVTIRAASVPAVGTIIKVLYSTNCTINYDQAGVVNYGGSLSIGNASLTGLTRAATSTLVPATSTNSSSWTDPLGIVQTVSILYDGFEFNMTTGDPSAGQLLTGLDDLNITLDVKIPPEGGYVTVYNSTYFAQVMGNRLNITYAGNMTVKYQVSPPNSLAGYEHEYVHVNGSILVRANHTLGYSSGYNVTANYTIAGLSLTKEMMGRYEWVVVGNHSRAIDSVGSAMVAEAFKEKQVVTDNGGLDQMDMWGTNIPYLLSDLGNATWRAGGPRWTDIYDSLGRLAYIDDWCTRYPVSTSNIITVAGPSANLFSEYFNEFSQAIQIYGITSGNLIDVIFAPTCWNTTKVSNYTGQYYYSNGQFVRGSTGTGIGVITTYKDINGTVGFMIYGWSGDDTYYTCKWFQEYGAYYLQTENRGVTTLVVRLDYNEYGDVTSNPMPPNYEYDAHNPEVTIIERLGTISEKWQHDP